MTTQTIDEKHTKVLQLIEQYVDNKLGIRLVQQNDLNKYLNLTATDIKKMTGEECGEASFILAQSSLYFQLENNKIQADINWCEEALNHLISKDIQQYSGKFIKYEQARQIIISNNEAALKLQQIIVNARLKLDTLQFLPARIEAIIRAINSIQISKRSEYAGR